MAKSSRDGQTAYELLQAWRQLERRLQQIPEDADERLEVERQRDESRDQYLSRFDSEVRKSRGT